MLLIRKIIKKIYLKNLKFLGMINNNKLYNKLLKIKVVLYILMMGNFRLEIYPGW